LITFVEYFKNILVMKTLIDDVEVAARGYYYLLDWNERDEWKTICSIYPSGRLCDLDINQYIQLFEIATKQDLEDLKNIIK